MSRKRIPLIVSIIAFAAAAVIRAAPTVLAWLSLPADLHAIAGTEIQTLGMSLMALAVLGFAWVLCGDEVSAFLGRWRSGRQSKGSSESVLVRATNPNANVSLEAVDSDIEGFDVVLDTKGERGKVRLMRTSVRSKTDE